MFNIVTRKTIEAIAIEKAGLLTKCEGLEATVKNLQDMSKDMVESQAEHNKVITELNAGYKKQIADLKASHQTELDTIKGEYEKQISELNAKVEIEKASSEAKAIKVLASIGVPADEVPKVEVAPVKSDNDILKEYEAASTKEKPAIFAKNKDKFLKLANVSQAKWDNRPFNTTKD